jgi:glycosyltransferase involved in cell wall biosynthesis
VNGVDLEQFFPAPSPAPSTLGLPTTEYYVVSVGQARPEKRIDTLIAAAAEIFRQEPGLSSTFVHVGGGQCLESWKKKAAELGLGERFQFPGGQANVVPYLRLATVFAHPAERESFGFAVAEAMACGKPVVAARSPGPAEIVGENGSGTLVEPGDVRGFARELLALLKDESRRQQIGNAGRARVVQYYDSRKQSLDLARVIQTELKKSS